jgi:hypothetical protein
VKTNERIPQLKKETIFGGGQHALFVFGFRKNGKNENEPSNSNQKFSVSISVSAEISVLI